MRRTFSVPAVTAVLAACTVVLVAPATATPPAGGACHAPWQENSTLVNPDDPEFFETIDKNQDGIICIKDWTGPDPDPDIGFLAIDNVGNHR